jgi:osmotically-inducible protein OsmY
MRYSLRQIVPLSAILLMIGAAGCQNTAEGVAEDTSKNTQAVAEDAHKAGEKMDAAGTKVAEGAKEAGTQIKEDAKTAGAAVVTGVKKTGEAAQNLGVRSEDLTRVKTAFAADAKLKSSDIQVDTLSDGSGVVLKGKVPSADQKALAAKVANGTLPTGKTVKNELTVSP